MKIALMHDGGLIGGVSTHIYNIFTNLQFHNVPVSIYQYLQRVPEIDLPSGTILVNKPKSKQEYMFDLLSKTSSLINLLSGSYWRVFKRINADITILSNPSLLRLTKYLPNCGVIAHDLYFAYKNPDSKLITHYFRSRYKLFDNAKFILSDSEFTKKDLMRKMEISSYKITTVYPYIDSSIFYPGKSNFRQALNFDREQRIILSVGLDQPNKNIETVIKLMTKLPENYTLVRVGKSESSRLLIHKLNLEKRIILLDRITRQQLADIYRGSDMLVFPSLFEGFGIPVLEAMASGLPVLISDRASLPEVTNSAGIISDPFDIEFMSEKIQTILEDEMERSKYQQMSIRRAAFFSMEQQFEQLIDALKKLQ